LYYFFFHTCFLTFFFVAPYIHQRNIRRRHNDSIREQKKYLLEKDPINEKEQTINRIYERNP
jgi:hypothetical protein